MEYGNKVTYEEVDGSFTIVELESGNKKAIGVAKLNCEADEHVADRGYNIAFYRAAEKLDKQLHPARYRKVKKHA
jgi:hypothetical protein